MSANILIVDDMPANLELLSSLLVKRGYSVRPAIDGAVALRSARASLPDLVLLDVDMPGMDGYEVCRRLKADETTRAIPVIFVSALGETVDKVKAFEVGAVDYVTKPFQLEEVVMRIESQLTLYRQRLELEELRERERQHFHRMNELKDHMVRTVSHDLKNPISLIVGYAELLKESGAIDDPESLYLIDQIARGARQMNELVVNLLDLARIEAGMSLSLEEASLSEFLYQVLEGFSVTAQKNDINLRLTLPDPDITVCLDPIRMLQVVNNLLSNAFKYTPAGGTIEVSASMTDDEAIIMVRDTGAGIPSDDLPQLFDKFYRVERDTEDLEGTGLGLSIVKAIVDQHDGRVWVESEVESGSTFYIALPRLELVEDVL